MQCIICSGKQTFYFEKQFKAFGLGAVEYWRCGTCGFVASKTHCEMAKAQWEALNFSFHTDSHARGDNPYNRNQRYFNQALMLHLMERGKLLSQGPWLDWGSGTANLAQQLKKWFSLTLFNFDAYFPPQINPVSAGQIKRGAYSLVINTGVFEHVRDRNTLDEVESCVAPGGQLAVHTLVRGQIPADPEWMYLLPVHCAFHTNTSMQFLMDQWKYTCSVYNEQAKLWVFFKRPSATIAEAVCRVNSVLGFEYLHFKPGFMDFWS